ncbi:MAG: hypothetical protein ABH824_05765 [Nanoarchaeota archaeon]|nr:hypothetical protein [Nanoarchaeota archaeon]MBU1631866.1 hypothetical protein [Nanoarchaeota archaeon]MBU1876071.1 hypothetical protein [Nanoarchaeota archaeon]
MKTKIHLYEELKQLDKFFWNVRDAERVFLEVIKDGSISLAGVVREYDSYQERSSTSIHYHFPSEQFQEEVVRKVYRGLQLTEGYVIPGVRTDQVFEFFVANKPNNENNRKSFQDWCKSIRSLPGELTEFRSIEDGEKIYATAIFGNECLVSILPIGNKGVIDDIFSSIPYDFKQRLTDRDITRLNKQDLNWYNDLCGI